MSGHNLQVHGPSPEKLEYSLSCQLVTLVQSNLPRISPLHMKESHFYSPQYRRRLHQDAPTCIKKSPLHPQHASSCQACAAMQWQGTRNRASYIPVLHWTTWRSACCSCGWFSHPTAPQLPSQNLQENDLAQQKSMDLQDKARPAAFFWCSGQCQQSSAGVSSLEVVSHIQPLPHLASMSRHVAADNC